MPVTKNLDDDRLLYFLVDVGTIGDWNMEVRCHTPYIPTRMNRRQGCGHNTASVALVE